MLQVEVKTGDLLYVLFQPSHFSVLRHFVIVLMGYFGSVLKDKKMDNSSVKDKSDVHGFSRSRRLYKKLYLFVSVWTIFLLKKTSLSALTKTKMVLFCIHFNPYMTGLTTTYLN